MTINTYPTHQTDVIVIGGGLAGLTAANILADAGLEVHLFEKAHHLGGRATSRQIEGFSLNIGPHALFTAGQAVEILNELGISHEGGEVTTNGHQVYKNGQLYALPSGIGSLLTTKALSFTEKLSLARFLVNIPRLKAVDYRDVTLHDWVQESMDNPNVREFLHGLFRLLTYSNAPTRMSAEPVIVALQSASKGAVKYLHNGWQTLVDDLYQRALKAGVHIHLEAKIDQVLTENGTVQGIQTADSTIWSAKGVVLAVAPQVALQLVSNAATMAWGRYAQQAEPVVAATLDLALRRLPNPDIHFALGIDKPLYFSVHSHWATLAPEGGAVVHVAKYLPDGKVSEHDRADLEELLDTVQPGWRAEVVSERHLPHIMVSNALITAHNGGMTGRPNPVVAEVQGLTLAGDWVGDYLHLVETALSSARVAAQHLIETVPVKSTVYA